MSVKVCYSLTSSYMKELKDNPSLKRITKFKYQKKHPGRHPVDIFPRKNVSVKEYYLNSIHDKQKATKIKELARSVRINEIDLGNDKMTHFAGVGASYYSKYRTRRKAGFNHMRSIKHVLWRGFQKEASILGLKWGTFSFSDLEANYQGFRMALNICEGANRHVKYINNKLTIVRPIDVKDYFNPGFDESYNRNYFRPFKLKIVADKILSKNYCSDITSSEMIEKFNHFRDDYKVSFAQKYAEKLLDIFIGAEAAYTKISDGNRYFPLTVEAQTFDKICNNQIDYDQKPEVSNIPNPDKFIEACPTQQKGFKGRGRILPKTRRDINSAIANYIQYSEDYCFASGFSDFETASAFNWVHYKKVSNRVPRDELTINTCLTTSIKCIKPF